MPNNNTFSQDDFDYVEKDPYPTVRELDLVDAHWPLEGARQRSKDIDVRFEVNEVRLVVARGNVTLADLGTSEEELVHLVRTGCEEEIREWLYCARYVRRHNRLYLYLALILQDLRWVINTHRRRAHKSFRAQAREFLCKSIANRRGRNDSGWYVEKVRELMAAANLSPVDIGTSEEELGRLRR